MADNPLTGPLAQIGQGLLDVATDTVNNVLGTDFGSPSGTGPTTPGIGNTPYRLNKMTVTGSSAMANDWRFRIGLMDNSDVLYRATDPGVLGPLLQTDGVVFPYTPNVLVNYRANYDKTSPTHSNYASYFYQSSEVSDVQINATFTAQSTDEADYMMAMIHFFRSCTKMFYGQDTNRGTPPPLVSVTGFGPNQFSFHKAVVSQFNYSLPDNVDYIRTSAGGPNSIRAQSTRGQLEGGQGQYGIAGIASRVGRLLGIGAGVGAETDFRAANEGTNLANAQSSYVPTKMEVSLILLPVVTRREQSTGYSTKDYAQGRGLSDRGYW